MRLGRIYLIVHYQLTVPQLDNIFNEILKKYDHCILNEIIVYLIIVLVINKNLNNDCNND